jgi:hypothetical protein
MVPDGAPVGFCSAPVAVVFEDLDEAQPKTIAMTNKTATIFVNLPILDLLLMVMFVMIVRMVKIVLMVLFV